MTSIHMDAQPPQQAINGIVANVVNQQQQPNQPQQQQPPPQQIQHQPQQHHQQIHTIQQTNTTTTTNYEEAERVRQRMSDLRKHHNDSAEIYNETQPKINEQIQEETMKYLKNNQVNGTKTKSQKPRAPKRQRNSTNNNSNNTNNNSINGPFVGQTNSIIAPPSTNGIPPQQPPQIQQVSSQSLIQQPGHMQRISLYPPRMQQQQQQQPMHMQTHQMQPNQQQQHFKYQTNNNTTNNVMFQPQQQQAQHQYQPQQPQQMYTQQQQQPPSQQPQHFAQQHHPPPHSIHHQHQNNIHQPHPSLHLHHQQNHAPSSSLPNDLDLTLQAGLECDVDSLIKHEMSVEGQLDFNHDLLLKLDNHYQPQIQQHQQPSFPIQKMQ